MSVDVPAWVKDAVFYQIFPDRFARSVRNPLPRGITLKPWGTPPEEQGFQGGDLYGIAEKLDYLQELGITALYLNPIFSSASNHRYHTYDYLEVDPLLGGNEALRVLVDELHARDMRIILDGVFNHASRGFWPFHHVLENGINSPYVDWFTVHDWPLVPYPPDAQTPINYSAWWGLPALPKLNVANPGVRDYLLEVAKYWIEFGVDGWRLDVAEEIEDVSFWQAFRQAVRKANPEAYIVAEIWHEGYEWLQGDRFDANMNYVWARAAICFFGAQTLPTDYQPGGFALEPVRAEEFAATLEQHVANLSWPVVQAQFNLLDSHDTARLLWTVGGDLSALRLCVLFQMTMPGAPCIYYGDEIGMTGATDPHCRAAFPWQDAQQWDMDMLDFFKRAIALRHANPVLRAGHLTTLLADSGVYACLRHTTEAEGAGIEDAALVIYNTRQTPVQLNLVLPHDRMDGAVLTPVWHGAQVHVRNGRVEGVHVPARDAVVLVKQ